MRAIYFAWSFPSLVRRQRQAQEHGQAADLRGIQNQIRLLAERIELSLGPASVLEPGPRGTAQASAEKLASIARLREQLQDFAGPSAWGAGLSAKEARLACDYSAERGGGLVVYSPVLTEHLSKTEGDSQFANRDLQTANPTVFQIEARLRDHADQYEQRQSAQRQVQARDLSAARAKAAAAIDSLHRSGRLADQAQRDPEGYQATMALIQAAQEALSKGGSFDGLPLPRIAKLKGMPNGTILHGKIKVPTAEGDRWRGARRGLIRDAQPESEGGRVGAIGGAKTNKSEIPEPHGRLTGEQVANIERDADSRGKQAKFDMSAKHAEIQARGDHVLFHAPLHLLWSDTDEAQRAGEEQSQAQENRIQEYSQLTSEPPPIRISYGPRSAARKVHTAFVQNGNHRVAAHRLRGRSTIEAMMPTADFERWRTALQG